MKSNVFKKVIVVGIILLIVAGIAAGIFLFKKDSGEIIDKPLEEVTMEDFKKTKVEIKVNGFDYPEYSLDYNDIYKEYLKPKYSNISVIESNENEINVIATDKKSLGDEINGIEVLDLKPFIENSIFGFNGNGENNFGTVYMEYVYGLSENKIYAIPEYINLPCIIYNTAFSEILDITIPSRWSELAIVKSELMDFEDYQNHLIAGYDKEHFDIVSTFVAQGYDEATAKYVIESWEKNGILKGYDKTNIEELSSDLPVIFIMPNGDTLEALEENSGIYGIGGMLLDDNDMLYINVNDGKHGQYLSVLKGDNVYEEIASFLYLKASIDTKYREPLTIKPFLEDNLTSDSKGEYNYVMGQLLAKYEEMYESDQIIFYQK